MNAYNTMNIAGFGDSEELVSLLENSIYKKARKNSALFHEGDQVEGVYLIDEGSIKLTRYDANGRERIVGIFSEHEFLWESFLLNNSTYPYTGVWLTKGKYYKISNEDFEKMLRKKHFAKKVIVLLSQKLHDANARNIYLAMEDPLARLAGFLVYSEQRRTTDYLELTLDDIAASINLRMETVSRKLKQLEREGLIKRAGKGKLEIVDYKKIQLLCQ